MKDKPVPIIKLLNSLNEEVFTDPKAKQVLEYCLENVQVSYKPSYEDADKTLNVQDGIELFLRTKGDGDASWIDMKQQLKDDPNFITPVVS